MADVSDLRSSAVASEVLGCDGNSLSLFNMRSESKVLGHLIDSIDEN